MGKTEERRFSLLQFFKKKAPQESLTARNENNDLRYETDSGDNTRAIVDKLELQESYYLKKLQGITNALEKKATNQEFGQNFHGMIAALKDFQSLPKINNLFENNELCPKRTERNSGMKRAKEKGGIKELGGFYHNRIL